MGAGRRGVGETQCEPSVVAFTEVSWVVGITASCGDGAGGLGLQDVGNTQSKGETETGAEGNLETSQR